jgi:hypothetical protein
MERRQSRIKILTWSWSRELRKNDAAEELLVPFLNIFFMLNISSKQEQSEQQLQSYQTSLEVGALQQ